MAEPNYTNRETVPQQRSNGALVFIVGGLVVAVAFVVWLFASGSNWSSYTAPEATQPAGETNITIDNSAPQQIRPPAVHCAVEIHLRRHSRSRRRR